MLRMDETVSSIHSDHGREENVRRVGDLTEDEFRALMKKVLQERNNLVHVSNRAKKIPVSVECKVSIKYAK